MSENNRELIMGKLSELQEKYILCPVYTTANKHIDESKEGSLTNHGSAQILTNSLAFDTDPNTILEILKNIDKGATYTYYMPKNKGIVNEIARYLGECMKAMPKVQTNPLKQKDIYERIKFYLFDSLIYCSYNFALFIQDAVADNEYTAFTQGWWYINPGKCSDELPDNIMIANEISNAFEIDYLTKCFNLLAQESSTKNFTGQKCIENLTNLISFVIEEA